MKILLQAYNTFSQNPGGGVQTKVMNLYSALRLVGADVELFNKWTTRIEDYDVIHFFKLAIEHYDLMYYAHKKGLKTVISSIVPLCDSNKIKAHILLNRLLPIHTIHGIHKRILDMSDVIISESDTESRFISQTYSLSPKKLVAMPNGVAPVFIDADPRLIHSKFGFSGDFVLQVGRIDSNKNQLRVIHALRGTGIPLMIIGGPHVQEPEYFDKCKSEADDNVFFTGWLNREDPLLASAYAAAKVLILPSIHEIYGNAIVEGGVAGCNLVCSNSVPICDWNIGEYIRKCNPYSVDDIRNKIIDAYNAPKIEGESEKFRRIFSWESIAQSQIDLYNSL